MTVNAMLLGLMLSVMYGAATVADWPPSSHIDNKYRIVGGRSTAIEFFPYQLQLKGIVEDNDGGTSQTMCGATLINDSIALTAAHCLNHIGRYFVRGGSSFYDRDGYQVAVNEVVVHPQYNASINHRFDIAVLFLEYPLPLNKFIGLAELPPLPEDPYIVPPMPQNLTGNVTGWGVTNYTSGQTADMLQVMEIPLVSWDICQDLVDEVDETKFCAGLLTGGLDGCQVCSMIIRMKKAQWAGYTTLRPLDLQHYSTANSRTCDIFRGIPAALSYPTAFCTAWCLQRQATDVAKKIN